MPVRSGTRPQLTPASPSLAASPLTQGVVLNGDPAARYWGNINLSFAYVEGESLLMGLKVGSGGAALASVWC